MPQVKKEQYLSYLNGQKAKIDMKDIYKGFKSSQRDRIDRVLSSVKEVVNKVYVQLSTLDIIYVETKRNSDLLVQLLNYFRQFLTDTYDGANRNESLDNYAGEDTINVFVMLLMRHYRRFPR